MRNTIQSSIPIQIEIHQHDDIFVAWPNDPDFPEFSGCIAQADSEEEVKKDVRTSLKAIVSYYKGESRRYAQRAIFRGNYTKYQLWFTIIGFGITFYWRGKKFSKKFPKMRPKYQFHIGRLWFSFRNEWKSYKKK